MTSAPPAPVLRVSAPRELLALVPYQLGFTPRQSLVLVSLRGPRRRVGLTVRVDLPHLGPEVRGAVAAHRTAPDLLERLRALAERLVQLVADDGATAVVAVVYDRPPAGHEAHDAEMGSLPAARSAQDVPGAEVAGLVEVVVGAACEARGLPLADTWWVDGERYRSLTCWGQSCCPPEGWPLTDLSGSLVAAEMVSRGAAPVAERPLLLADLGEERPERVEVAERAERSWRRRARRAGQDRARSARLRAEGLALVRRALADAAGGDGPAPADLGAVAATLADPWVRDAVLLALVPGSGPVPERLALHGTDPRADELLSRLVSGSAGPALAPDTDLLEQGERLLTAVVRHVPGRGSAHALAVLAWLSWWRGDGARAVSCAERALATGRHISLARLVLDILDAGVPPAWVRAQREQDLTSGPPPVSSPRPGDAAC